MGFSPLSGLVGYPCPHQQARLPGHARLGSWPCR